MSLINPYNLLGVTIKSNLNELKKSYYNLSNKWDYLENVEKSPEKLAFKIAEAHAEAEEVKTKMSQGTCPMCETEC